MCPKFSTENVKMNNSAKLNKIIKKFEIGNYVRFLFP